MFTLKIITKAIYLFRMDRTKPGYQLYVHYNYFTIFFIYIFLYYFHIAKKKKTALSWCRKFNFYRFALLLFSYPMNKMISLFIVFKFYIKNTWAQLIIFIFNGVFGSRWWWWLLLSPKDIKKNNGWADD